MRQVKYYLWSILLPAALFIVLASRIGGFKTFQYAAFRGPGPGSPGEQGEGRIAQIIDGDTVILQDGRKIRYLNMDCPEKGEPFYLEALRFNQRLVEGKKIRLIFCPGKKKDRYGRWLAHVFCGEECAGRALLREGLAFPALITPCGLDVEAAMASDFLEAQARGRGIWGREDLFYVSTEKVHARIGRHAIIEGSVSGSFENERLTYLDIGDKSAGNVRLVVLSAYRESFREKGINLPEAYQSKKVKAWGKLEDYKGRPEIFLFSPDQIRVVNGR